MQVSGSRRGILLLDLCKRRLETGAHMRNLSRCQRRGAPCRAGGLEEVQTLASRGDGERNEGGRQGGGIYDVGKQKGRRIDPPDRGAK